MTKHCGEKFYSKGVGNLICREGGPQCDDCFDEEEHDKVLSLHNRIKELEEKNNRLIEIGNVMYGFMDCTVEMFPDHTCMKGIETMENWKKETKE